MTSLQVYRLQPKGAFHFGVHGIDAEQSAEHCPSDTLYAALNIEARLARRSFFAPPEHNDITPLDPPLLLSSAYPYAGQVLLLPCPRLRLPLRDDVEGRRKLFKRLSYVSPTIFRLILEQGEDTLEEYLPDAIGGREARGSVLMGGQVWVAHDDGELPPLDGDLSGGRTFWQFDTVPHVTVDRLRHSSNYHQVGQVRFAEGCGLYLLCQERHTGATAELADLLQRVGDSGLGGRRSQGLGAFAVEPQTTLDLPEASNPDRMVLLSRYRPSQPEISGGVLEEPASYDLVRVGGWLQSPDANTAAQRRRSLRMLNEGSVIRIPEGGRPLGTICDLRPEYTAASFPHPVWRYGLALGIGIGGA